ncbi:glucosaminidase domain-containing protein [Alicyclobacillus pomorum]|uniref:glucosaminidase domain-containing protein n=1 Tax=Alicyclobacillus pomorum TaxID=204470 RepID=UPI000686A3E2|nr:glucosaminidase domain-containing protein [Alicyclobacillus pomorum]
MKRYPVAFVSTIPTILALAAHSPIVQASTYPTVTTQSTSNALAVKHIYFNNQLQSSPYGIVENNTTYLPIWYVMQVLNRIGIENTWNHKQWNLSVPSSYEINWNNISVGSGDSSISLNGTVVQKVNALVHVDPASGKETTFMPIWYVMKVLNWIGIQSTWNGTDWRMMPPAGDGITDVRVRHIYYDGKLMSSPYGFVKNNTTYMPVWYIQNVLKSIGIPNTFSNQSWSLSIPSYYNLDLSNISVGQGSTSISLNGTVVIRTDTLSHLDPYSGNQTTYIPIWSVMQALNRIGIKSSWVNATDWQLTPSFTTVDLRYPAPGNITASSIDSFLKSHNSPFTGLGASYIYAQNTYGVDANYLVSHSIEESGWTGSDLSTHNNNLYGYGAYDWDPNAAGMFPSDDYAIRFQAWEVRNNYLTPGSSHYVAPTLTGMNRNYASDPNWAANIGAIMNELAASTNDSVQSYKQWTGDTSTPAPTPNSTEEPVFYLNGASGVIQTNPTYQGLPYYPDMASGETEMYYGQTLQLNSSGTNVVTLQTYLNQTIHSGLVVDGQFGQLTKEAVINFQKQNGLQETGTWDYTLWKQYIEPSVSVIPAGTSVHIDQMKQGMSGPYVMEWYHIPGYGWVDGQYVHFDNVYRVTVQNPNSPQTSVPVYDGSGQQIAMLHSGDFVVSTNAQGAGGMIPIQFANEWTGQLMTGYIHTSDGWLTPQE